MVDKDQLFNPVKMSAQAKAAQTDKTAKDILAAEAAARAAKTAKLRSARLDQAPVPDTGENGKATRRTKAK
ncbi:hypothetical protein LJR030_004201 [Rhizobium sp. LjRoot30]|uniref:hypothetical protein n=1 Tax=Rhizobium sp. LjRoot30 TaxID=3342320 RepID=UPI003ED1072B